MNVTGTINAGMSKMARSMRNSVDNCKTDGKIAALEGEKKKTTIICEECGAKTSIEMKYCGVCGKSLTF